MATAATIEPREIGDASAPAGLPIREVLRVLRARKWTLFGTLALVLLVAALATFSQTPIYRATSLLLIEPRKPNVANVQEVYDPITAGISLLDYYRTQFEILKSRRIVEPVATRLRIAEREEFRGAADPVATLIARVVVEPVRDSRLVRVSVDSPDPRFATEAANAIVEQFVDENSQRTLGVSDSGLRTLREMERALRPKHEEAARALQQYKEENEILSIDETQSIAVQEMKVLAEQLSMARAERARVAAERASIAAALASGIAAATLPVMARSKVVDELALALAQLEQDREDLLKTYRSEHPRIRALDARITHARARLRAEEAAIVATVENRLQGAIAHEKELEAALAAAGERVAALGRKGIRLQMLREEAETIASSYRNIAKRIEEVEVAIATGAKANNVFLIDPALEPSVPISPRKRMNLLLGALFGVLAGAGLCFLLEHLDDTVKSQEEVEHLLGYPVLGFVPRVDAAAAAVQAAGSNGGGNGHGPPAIELTAVCDPRSPIAESFRTIRTGLGFTLPARGAMAVVVTSAGSGDGKTFTSVNLAFALAQTGKRVLLVDADLRRPRLHEIFGVEGGERGLSTTIAGGGEPTLDAVRRTGVGTLDLLPAGPVPPNPAELLGAEATKVFLARALAEYDWVILDAPPVTAVADAAILLGYAPHAIFVVRAFSTVKHGARRAREVLEQAPGRVVGVILNTVDVPAGRGQAYYGGYGYRYAHPYRERRRRRERALAGEDSRP